MPKRHRPNKEQSQRFHARKRAAERFGIDFTRHVRRDVIRRIQAGQGTHIEKQSNRISVWELLIDDKRVWVVYDKSRKNIVTFLNPKDPNETGIEQQLPETLLAPL